MLVTATILVALLIQEFQKQPLINYSKFGFSFSFPSASTIAEEGNESGGTIHCLYESKKESIAIAWWTVEPMSQADVEMVLEDAISNMTIAFEGSNITIEGAGGEISKGEKMSRLACSHQMVYQGVRLEILANSHLTNEVFLVAGVWYCNITHRRFVLLVRSDSSEEIAFREFQRLADSFTCH
ncbi:MAG: hypothetical protein KIH10_16025 [Candidatus Freyarchaeota archaeon]|nr:hypothetical protein [Candidatus Jordarchaeia archaeon]